MSAARSCPALSILVALLTVLAAPAGSPRAATEPTLNAWWGLHNGDPWDPPDALGAVGPRGILHINNDRIQYLSKEFIRYPEWVSVDLRDFFPPPPPPNITNDPRVVYDPQSERFF